MNLGAFSLSLCVEDLERSRAFYEKLGFAPMGGDAEQGWLILKSPTLTLGLFQKFIEKLFKKRRKIDLTDSGVARNIDPS